MKITGGGGLLNYPAAAAFGGGVLPWGTGKVASAPTTISSGNPKLASALYINLCTICLFFGPFFVKKA